MFILVDPGVMVKVKGKSRNNHLPANLNTEIDGFYELPEEERFYALCKRYPTFLIIMKVVQRHQRLRRFTGDPNFEFMLDKAKELLEEALNELVMAFPPIAGKDVISLPSILHTLADELETPIPRERRRTRDQSVLELLVAAPSVSTGQGP